MPGPAATIGSMHTCPMCNPGGSPHTGGPVAGPGVPTVLIGGKPAAVMGDMCTCSGPPDTIVMGEGTVLIGGKPATTIGSMTAHGGVITVGETTVLIGTGASPATVVMPVKKIPFPEITVTLKVMASLKGNSDELNEAIANQEEIRRQSESNEGEPRIYGIRILKKETVIKESMVSTFLTIKARVMNIGDGESITFKVTIPPVNEEGEEEVIELTGTVEDKEVSVDWQPENNNNTEQS